jgi:predicted DCC family thiol-disulfide oxidoreductase YuxK
LIFDGDCGFCTTSVDWAARMLPAMPEASPYQWTDLDVYGLTTQEAAERVWFVDSERQYGGSLAIAAVLRHQPNFGYRFLGWLASAPPWSWFAAVVYHYVAKYRHALPGGTPACQMKP